MAQLPDMKYVLTAALWGSAIFSSDAAFAGTGQKDSASYYMELGRTELSARKYSNAWRFMEKAGQHDPKNADIQKEIAAVCFKMNRSGPAIKALEQAVSIDPTDSQTLLELAKMYFNYGQWEQTLTTTAKVKQRLPAEKGIDFMMGKANYMLQDYGKTITHMKVAIKEDAGSAEANYLMARSLTIMSNYNAAVPFYEASLAIDAEQPTRMYEYAMVLATAGQADKSIAWFQKVIDAPGFKPRDDFYMNMAYTMAEAKKTAEAVDMLDKVLARRPQDIGLLYGIADVCYHSKQYKRAISYWDRVLEYDKTNARSLYMIGLSYQKMGNDTEGKALCDRAIGMDPSLAALKRKREMN